MRFARSPPAWEQRCKTCSPLPHGNNDAQAKRAVQQIKSAALSINVCLRALSSRIGVRCTQNVRCTTCTKTLYTARSRFGVNNDAKRCSRSMQQIQIDAADQERVALSSRMGTTMHRQNMRCSRSRARGVAGRSGSARGGPRACRPWWPTAGGPTPPSCSGRWCLRQPISGQDGGETALGEGEGAAAKARTGER